MSSDRQGKPNDVADINGDGVSDVHDITQLTRHVTWHSNVYNWAIDYDFDGDVDFTDAYWMLVVMNSTSQPGDVNLDGSVDPADEAIITANLGSGPSKNWSHGDMNGDGYVDNDDMSIYSTQSF